MEYYLLQAAKVNDDCNLFEYTRAPGIEWHQSVADQRKNLTDTSL